MHYKNLLFTGFMSLLVNVCSAQTKLKPGIWRGALKTSSGNDLPFNFEVKESVGKQLLFIMNGLERIKVTDLTQKKDSVFIHMPLFNSEFKLKFTGIGLRGKWIKHYADRDMAMDFVAEPGQAWRFFKTAEKHA